MIKKLTGTDQQELDRMISSLDDIDERAIMRLRYLGGHTVKAIADAIGMTERNVYNKLKRARARIREEYHCTLV